MPQPCLDTSSWVPGGSQGCRAWSEGAGECGGLCRWVRGSKLRLTWSTVSFDCVAISTMVTERVGRVHMLNVRNSFRKPSWLCATERDLVAIDVVKLALASPHLGGPESRKNLSITRTHLHHCPWCPPLVRDLPDEVVAWCCKFLH